MSYQEKLKLARACRNYSIVNGLQYELVTEQMLQNHALGVDGWAEATPVPQSCALALEDGSAEGSVAGKPKSKAKGKAKTKAKAGAAPLFLQLEKDTKQVLADCTMVTRDVDVLLEKFDGGGAPWATAFVDELTKLKGERVRVEHELGDFLSQFSAASVNQSLVKKVRQYFGESYGVELQNYMSKVKPIVDESSAIVQKVNRMWSSMESDTPASVKKQSPPSRKQRRA